MFRPPMKMYDRSLSLLFLLALIAGCGSEGEAPQSSGDNNEASVSNDVSTPDDVAVLNDTPVPVPAGNIETETQTLEPGSDRKAEPVYAVAEYDADRDPAVDLAAAIDQASSDGKRILLEIGGNW